MKILPNISWRSLDDRVVAVNTESGVYYTMNGTASAIWSAMAEGLNKEQIVAKILDLYDIADAESVAHDIDEQLREWEKECLINK